MSRIVKLLSAADAVDTFREVACKQRLGHIHVTAMRAPRPDVILSAYKLHMARPHSKRWS